jgi:hypothetical protein
MSIHSRSGKRQAFRCTRRHSSWADAVGPRQQQDRRPDRSPTRTFQLRGRCFARFSRTRHTFLPLGVGSTTRQSDIGPPDLSIGTGRQTNPSWTSRIAFAITSTSIRAIHSGLLATVTTLLSTRISSRVSVVSPRSSRPVVTLCCALLYMLASPFWIGGQGHSHFLSVPATAGTSGV